MELTPKGKIIKGYKATDKDMCCRGFKFELGKWHEHDGELSLCVSGFHFCEYPSGPFAYYQLEDTRIFECEAEFVLLSSGPGADLKHVAKKIRLTKEINITGDRNTGDRNTGNGNVGNYHSGYFNIGEADFIVFGKKADRKNFDFSLANELCDALSKDDDFDANDFCHCLTQL